MQHYLATFVTAAVTGSFSASGVRLSLAVKDARRPQINRSKQP